MTAKDFFYSDKKKRVFSFFTANNTTDFWITIEQDKISGEVLLHVGNCGRRPRDCFWNHETMALYGNFYYHVYDWYTRFIRCGCEISSERIGHIEQW